MKKKHKRKHCYRKVIVKRYSYIDPRVRVDPQFLVLFTKFARDIERMSKKKYFNKKEFSQAFAKFNNIIGIYPFPNHLITRYMKHDIAREGEV